MVLKNNPVSLFLRDKGKGPEIHFREKGKKKKVAGYTFFLTTTFYFSDFLKATPQFSLKKTGFILKTKPINFRLSALIF